MKIEKDNSENVKPNSRRSFLKKMGAIIAGGIVFEKIIKKYKFDSSIEIIQNNTENTNSQIHEKVIDSELERLKKIYEILIRDWPKPKEEQTQELPRTEIEPFDYKISSAEFEYVSDISEPKIEGLNVFEDVGKFGQKDWGLRFIQVFRFQPITMAVERKYNLPRNLLLAMIMQESSGEENLPNAKDDGGFGLVHMQSGTAKEFGLEVYGNCSAIVCDGKDERSCVDEKGEKISHAKELRKVMEMNLSHRDVLVKLDERLHHLKNIDTAGRILSFHISRYPKTLKTLPESLKNLGPLRAAICKYSGPKNFPEYWERIRTFMALCSNQEFLNTLFQKMETDADHGEINEKKLNYLNYIQEWQKFYALNYGLESYIKGDCYTNNYSESILKSYQRTFPEINEEAIRKFSR